MTILFNKKRSETPLQALERLREEQPEIAKERLSYAGRLDPMADGSLLVLVGEENDNRDNFLNLDKEYTAEILWGVTTDTYDVLGLVQKVSEERPAEQRILQEVEKVSGKFLQSYPPYSSKTVSGKPLYEYAREGTLDDIDIPQKEVEIYSANVMGHREIDASTLLQEIVHDVSLVAGDFRQEEIIERWRNALAAHRNFMLTKIYVRVSSGVYVRSLVDELGKKLGCGALAYSITRTKIGV